MTIIEVASFMVIVVLPALLIVEGGINLCANWPSHPPIIIPLVVFAAITWAGISVAGWIQWVGMPK